jgi:hypothetical protein
VFAGLCPDVPCVSRSFSSTGETRIQREGEPALRAYPLAEVVEDVCAHGGWLELSVATNAKRKSGQVRVFVDESRITDIHLRAGPWLEPLGLRSAQMIAEVFGHNDHYARANGKTTWAWPDRDFAVVWSDAHHWNAAPDQLEAIALGPRACASVPMFGAEDLITLTLRWKRLHGDDDWPLHPNESSLAEPIIAGRIAALMRAFGVHGESPSLDGFCEGAFLGTAEHERAAALLDYLERAQLRFEPDGERDHDVTEFSLARVWSRMFALRCRIEAIEAFDEGVLVASGIFRHMVEISEHATKQLAPTREHIDRMLSLILDPTQRTFTWGQLVREHGFPDDDLEQAENEDT